MKHLTIILVHNLNWSKRKKLVYRTVIYYQIDKQFVKFYNKENFVTDTHGQFIAKAKQKILNHLKDEGEPETITFIENNLEYNL